MEELVRRICSVFPFLFVFELFFGYSGKMIVVGGVTVRQFLFVGTFLSLYFYCLYCIFCSCRFGSTALKKKVLTVFPKICLLDVAFLVVIFSMVFFSTVVPFLTNSNMVLAKNEVFSSVLMLLLSFPLFYLVKNSQINVPALKKYIYYLVFVLSCLHILLYIGQGTDAHFIYKYFFFLNTILGKTSIFPAIMLGHAGVPRIFFTTSIFLPVGVYFSLKKIGRFGLFDHIYLAVNTLAMLSTMTKSLWGGVLIGLFCYLLFTLVVCKNKRKFKLAAVFIAEIFSFTLVSNFTIFDNRIFHHFGNSFVYEQSSSPSDDLNENFKIKIKEKFRNNVVAYHDREGSVISNNIKIKQMHLLLKKWIKKPLFGYGYGSYIEDFVRSEESPFSYEMVFFSLLMKTGIVGILCWMFLIFSLFYIKYKYRKYDTDDFFCWTFLFVAFISLVQTNPLLFNSVGMAFLLFISLDAVYSFAKNTFSFKNLAVEKNEKSSDDRNTVCVGES